MTVTVSPFVTLQLLVGDGGTPTEVFAILASVNMQRSFEFQTETTRYHNPDPNNPDSPVPSKVNVRSHYATIPVAGRASATDIDTLLTWGKAGTAKNVKLVDLETNSYTIAASVKMTNLKWTSDPDKGESATFDATLETDGDYTVTAN